MNESELLQYIQNRASGLADALAGGWSLRVGPGDDCAVLAGPDGEPTLITVDQLVAGVHFTPGTPLDLVARKAVARSVSDLAAMGSTPCWSTATGLLPAGFNQGTQLIDSLNAWASHWGCPVVGGDLAFHASPDHPMTLTVTAAGIMDPGHRPVLRSGAAPGDLLYLTGPLGGSFIESTGLGHHLTFEPRLDAGRWASTVHDQPNPQTCASAMIDLSDGLGRDASRVATASRLAIEINAAAIPLREGVTDWKDAASGGEDYELLITIPQSTAVPENLGLIGPIGACRALREGESPGCIILDADGNLHDASTLGWDHGSQPANNPPCPP